MRIIIAASKDYTDYAMVKCKMDVLTKNLNKVVVISRDEKGGDKLGQQWATEKLYLYVIHRAKKFSKHGNKASSMRDDAVIQDGSVLVTFGKDKGIEELIEKAKEKGLKIREYE